MARAKTPPIGGLIDRAIEAIDQGDSALGVTTILAASEVLDAYGNFSGARQLRDLARKLCPDHKP